VSIYSNAQESERQAYLFYNGDGLLDIFAGLGILFAGLFLMAGLPWLVAIFPTSLGPAWYGAKKAITAPRVAGVSLPAGAQRQVTRALAALALVGVLALLLGIAAAVGVSRDALPPWLLARPALVPAMGFGLPLILGLLAAAAVLGTARYSLYALVTALIFGAGYLLAWEVWWSLVAAGAAIALGGVTRLFLFLYEHPRE
jgi:hypothetical protein